MDYPSGSDQLFQEERHRQIIALVEQHGRVTVVELSRRFALSATTIRKDLDFLSERELLQRTHGGAIDLSRGPSELSFDTRRRLHAERKQAIGRVAANMVADGEAIILDASTTTLAMAPYLRGRREMTVFTNGLPLAMALMGAPGVRVLMPSGTLRAESASLVDGNDQQMLSVLHFHKGFFGAKGISPREGLTLVDSAEVAIKRCMLGRAQRTIALIDSSKWRQIALAPFAAIDHLDCIVTDEGAPAEMVATVQNMGVELILANAP